MQKVNKWELFSVAPWYIDIILTGDRKEKSEGFCTICEEQELQICDSLGYLDRRQNCKHVK